MPAQQYAHHAAAVGTYRGTISQWRQSNWQVASPEKLQDSKQGGFRETGKQLLQKGVIRGGGMDG